MNSTLYENSKSKYPEIDSTLSFKDFRLFKKIAENFHKIVTIFFLNSYLNFCDKWTTYEFRRFCIVIIPSILYCFSLFSKLSLMSLNTKMRVINCCNFIFLFSFIFLFCLHLKNGTFTEHRATFKYPVLSKRHLKAQSHQIFLQKCPFLTRKWVN